MRLLILTLALIVAGTGLARAEPALTPAQEKAVERVVHDYLVKHPDVLMEAMQAAEAKAKAQKEASIEQTIRDRHHDIFDDPDAQVGGNPRGDVTIVEFFDYRCPYCKEVQPHLESLLKSDRHLRVIYKEFPILGPVSVYASKIALAARAQGKYLAFHRAMMDEKGTITDEVVLAVARSVGVDVAKAKAAMDAPRIAAVIKKDYALADALNIDGTPAFIIAGKLYNGALDFDRLKRLVAEARRDHAG
jgi:protein-disulfide isomerase